MPISDIYIRLLQQLANNQPQEYAPALSPEDQDMLFNMAAGAGGTLGTVSKGLFTGGKLIPQKQITEKTIQTARNKRPSHNIQNRQMPKVEGKQLEMKRFLDHHDYPYFIKKDGSISIDIMDSTGKFTRFNAKNMKDVLGILGY